MTIRTQLGRLRQAIQASACARLLPLGPCGSGVSFCFDDFPRDAYLSGGKILRSLGVRGTYYVASGLLLTRGNVGDMATPGDLENALRDGHELGLHTHTHCSARRMAADAFESDVLRGRDALHAMTGIAPEHFAYPYGHVTLPIKKRLGRILKSCRGIQLGANGPSADLNLLRGNSLYGDVEQMDVVERLLQESRQRQRWVIFYTHDVRRTPSAFGCTPELLERAVELSLKMGFWVKPVGTVVDWLLSETRSTAA